MRQPAHKRVIMNQIIQRDYFSLFGWVKFWANPKDIQSNGSMHKYYAVGLWLGNKIWRAKMTGMPWEPKLAPLPFNSKIPQNSQVACLNIGTCTVRKINKNLVYSTCNLTGFSDINALVRTPTTTGTDNWSSWRNSIRRLLIKSDERN